MPPKFVRNSDSSGSRDVERVSQLVDGETPFLLAWQYPLTDFKSNMVCVKLVELSNECLLSFGTLILWLPVKTAPVENGPSPKRPHFRLKRPQFSVKTAPY